MSRRTLVRLPIALAISFLAGAACLSPTLPLPPPHEPDTMRPSAEDTGVWELSGDCEVPGARVTIFNDRTGQGAVIEDRDRNGRYRAEIEAEACDVARIWYEVVGEGGVEQSA